MVESMINLNKLIGSGEFTSPLTDMQPFICLLAGLTIATNAQIVFEIGTHILNSGKAFLFGLEKTGGMLYTCDPIRSFYYDHPNLEFIQKTSHEIAKAWKEKIDILFIDGDHEYKAVKDDFFNFFLFVRDGGLIILHDTNYFPGPKRMVKEIMELKGISLSGILSFWETPGLTIFQKIKYMTIS